MYIPTDQFTTDIITALSKRDFVFDRVTKSIAKKIDFVFEAIIEYLEQNAHEITWESLSASNDLLIIVAKIPGTPSPQILSVGIPFDVIQHQSKDKVIEFFLETEQEQKRRKKDFADSINEELEARGSSARVKGSTNKSEDEDNDVDLLYDMEDNKLTFKQKLSPKRVLH